MIRQSNLIPTRTGNTSTQLLGVVIALGLGLGLGFYIIQPERLSFASTGATDEAAIDKGRQESAPVAAGADTHSEEMAEQIRDLKQEIAQLREQNAAPQREHRSRVNTGRETRLDSNPKEREQAESGRRVAANADHEDMGRGTLDYWNRLNDIIIKEESMRQPPQGGVTAANALDFLSRRGQAGQFAEKSIRKLPKQGVDPEVVRLASDIALWYDKGNEFNDTADSLMNADESARRGAAGQQWGDAEKQHGLSVDALNRRGDELRERMSGKYGLPFPDLR